LPFSLFQAFATAMTTLSDLRNAYLAGQTEREKYHREMSLRHAALREYHALLTGSDVTRIEIDKDELVVVTTGGVRLQWNPDHARLAPDILVNTGRFEPDDSLFLLDAARGTRVAFDIGANIGYYALHWLPLQAAGGVVHAFEPVPYAHAILSRNIAMNGAQDRVVVNDVALADARGSRVMFVPGTTGSGASSFRNLHADETNEEISVRVETLDDYFSGSGLAALDLIKADVEGAELLVMQGGMRTIARHKPLICLELLRKWSAGFGYHPNDVIALLGSAGYACYAGDKGRLFPFTRMTDETRQTNFVFAHPDRHGDYLARHLG
jgi:FkbM family methyltransferase